jgi:integrase
MLADERGGGVLDSPIPAPINLRQVGRHLSRPRSQRGWLSDHVPGRGKLARGRFFGRWRVYFTGEDGGTQSRKAEKVIDRALAEQMGFELANDGPLNKTDARRVLEKLIRESNATPSMFSGKTTLGELGREYLDLNKPNWGTSTARVNDQVIESHLIGTLGSRPVRELTDAELQRFINGYVEKGSSVSLLSKLVFFLRRILEMAVDRRLIDRNPARHLKARSRKRRCALSHTLEECDALYSHVSGRDHLAIRILVQLGLRSEELFALRRDDVRGDELVIDEAMVDGETKEPKTLASAAVMYCPPDLALELEHHLETIKASRTAWLFPSSRAKVPLRPGNFLRRVLKPAAIRAGIAVSKDAKGQDTTALNFQSLRRTSSTLFGARAKDPKSTQAHMRHADPQVTLKHYQQSIPAEVRAAALALETDLLAQKRKREEQSRAEAANVRPS